MFRLCVDGVILQCYVAFEMVRYSALKRHWSPGAIIHVEQQSQIRSPHLADSPSYSISFVHVNQVDPSSVSGGLSVDCHPVRKRSFPA